MDELSLVGWDLWSTRAPNFKSVFSHYMYKIQKVLQNLEIWVVYGDEGHSRSSAISCRHLIKHISYDLQFAFNRNYTSISYRLQKITSYVKVSLKLSPAFGA